MPAVPATIVGVISDTHGLLRPEVLEALRGSDLILHAGDVGDRAVLDRLGAIAPVTAVRGNVDTAVWATALRETEVVEIGTHRLFMLHDLAALRIDAGPAGIAAVISGHTHRPVAAVRDGVLFLNPGSAGPRRFRLPVSLARITLRGDALTHEFVDLAPPGG
jgi:putative phosphoesterase